MVAVAFFLLAVALTLIVVGLSRLLSWFLDRRDAAIHADWRAKQLVLTHRLQQRRNGGQR